jgi:hypothetical protein
MSDIEKDAADYAAREFAKLDDPTLTDIEVWERHLGIDDADIRDEFDRRLVLKRGGVDVEPLFSVNERADAEAVVKTVYAEYAAEQRNPAPHVPHDDPEREANDAKSMVLVVQEAFSREALKRYFFRQRRDALQRVAREHEREAEQLRMKRERLATPVVLEGELLPATRPRSR